MASSTFRNRTLESTRSMDMRSARDEIDQHQNMMNKLQQVAEEATNATQACLDALDTLTAHNTDAAAHPDLRATVENTGAVTSAQLDERIEQHNTSRTAHPELITELKGLISDTTVLVDTVTGRITEHNVSESAHADIRSAISSVNNLLAGNNITEMKGTVSGLKTKVEDTILPGIAELQSVDARHDSQIGENKEAIAETKRSIKAVAADVDGILQGYAGSQTKTDEHTVRITELDVAERLGLKANADRGPRLVNMVHTLPIYVDKQQRVTFTIANVLQADGSGRNVTLDLEVLKGDFTLDPMQCSPGTDIAIVGGTTGDPGDINYFKVKATDGTTGIAVERILAYMVTRPIDELTQVSINNLPPSAEPGKVFSCTIRNVVDEDDGRFTYSVDPLQSGIVFSKSENITISETFTITIPDSAVRGTTLSFQLTSHDKYATERVKTVTVKINELPSKDDFEIDLNAVMAPKKSYQMRARGIYSIEGLPATYSIDTTDTEGKLTFGKTTGILANENVQITVAASAARGSTISFTVKSIDKNGVEFKFPQSVKINRLPTSTTITTTLPATTEGGKTIEMTISGGEDPDDDSRTIQKYEIDPGSSGLTFAVTRNVTTATSVSVTIPKVPSQVVRSFNIYAIDEIGERAKDPKQINLTIDPIRVIDTPVITSPHEGDEVNPEFTITWSAYSEHVEA